MKNKFIKIIFLTLFFEFYIQAQQQPIANQIGTNLTSLKKLIGGDITINSLDNFPNDLLSMPGFNFNFWTKTGDYNNYSFISVSPGANPTSGQIQTALDNTPFANFDWSPVLQAITNGGVYIALLAFDANNKFLNSLKNINVTSMVLAVYDSSGNLLSGMPLIFSASNYTTNPIGTKGAVHFFYKVDVNNPVYFAIYDGPTVLASSTIINYPFLMNVKSESSVVVRTLELIRAVYTQPISNYTSLQSLTLTRLQQLIPALVTNQTKVTSEILSLSTPSVAAWNLNLNQMLNQQTNNKGYAFIEDPWNSISTVFNSTTKTGIAANINVGPINRTIQCVAMNNNCSGQCSMVLLGFDANNQYISDIIATAPTTFGLFMYDANGDILSGFPVQFSANNYVGLGSYSLQPNAKAPATFVLGGLGLLNFPTLTYPFTCTIQWSY